MEALSGITVLDLARGFPPAFGTMFLADFGARVIKIDPFLDIKDSHGSGQDDEYRKYVFNPIHRNKESIVINLKHSEGLNILYALIKRADVFVEGFRPGVMKRLGADYATVKTINDRLIYCSVSGYGSDGPYAQMPGHDPNYLALSGALSMIGHRDGAPCMPSNYLADFAGAGLHPLIGILIALMARERTHKGQWVDLSFFEGVLSLMNSDIVSFFATGKAPHRGETITTGSTIWSHIYKCKDNQYLSVACGELPFWENLCRAIGREELIILHDALLPEQERGIKELESVFITKTRYEWWELLKDSNTCVMPVNNIDEVFTDPQIIHRKMVMELDHPTLGKVKQLGFPVKLSDTPAQIKHLTVEPGANTTTIMAELGYSSQDIERLIQGKVIN